MKLITFNITKKKFVLIAVFYMFMLSFVVSKLTNSKNKKPLRNNLLLSKQIDITKINKLIQDVSKNLKTIIPKTKSAENKYENIISSNPNNNYRYKTKPSTLQKTNIKILNTRVKCPLGTAMNGFHIGEIAYNYRKKLVDSNLFEYNCYKHKLILDKFLNFKTEKISFDKIDLIKSNVNKLLKLKIKCPEAFLLTKFRLAFTKKKQIYYRYQCAESDVEDEVCEYSDSNKVVIPIVELKQKTNTTKTNEKNDKINSDDKKDKEEKKGKEDKEDKKEKEDKEDKKEDKPDKGATTIISLENLKKLYVDAPQGKFIKTFKLKFDEHKNEIYYRIKSCRIIDDEDDDENDPDYELEEEENGEPELKEDEEELLINTPHEVLKKASIINTNSINNSNVIVEPEEENEEFNKKYDRYELMTIGNTEAKQENNSNNRNEQEDD